jgi:iron(III) transport system permease protein
VSSVARRRSDTTTLACAGIAVLALAVVPWAMTGGDSAALRALAGDRGAMMLVAVAIAAFAAAWIGHAGATALAAAIAVVAAFAAGFAAGPKGASLGIGAAIALTALVVVFARALAARDVFKGDKTVAMLVIVIASLLLLFVFLPVGQSLITAFQDSKGNFAPDLATQRLFSEDIWGLGCFGGTVRCGVAVNSLLLAILAGVFSALLGLVLALVIQRGGQRFSKLLQALSILPIITPPFVIALALVVLFGRTGIVTGWLDVAFGIPRSRWIYGLPGVLLAQLLSFTPIAFLILYGALQAVSPALEEAAQTLRAERWRVFHTVTFPLLRPALANAFLLGFVESLADFGNPIVLAGNFDVLSVKIYYSIAGAQHDPGRAAVLALVLLGFTLIAFWLQQAWLGRASYVTVSGKGDGGVSARLPKPLWRICVAIAATWIVFTLICYLIIIVGGFVKDIGRGDMTFTMHHFGEGFAVEWGAQGLRWVGSAWNSFFTTVEVAAVAAPLTTLIGLGAAYVIARHRFAGRRAFEFLTMVSFAIPGTVIGVAYVVAFNVAPLELTGGMAILVLCFVFRNMPVGVRAGVAALAQIDPTLDEASATLRARTTRTLSKIIVPLLRPAIVATLVFSFTHAMTAVSAVIFLATARYNLATVYIVGRVEAGEYPLAIAYSSVLIVFMLAVILVVQKLIGEARLGRRPAQLLATGN